MQAAVTRAVGGRGWCMGASDPAKQGCPASSSKREDGDREEDGLTASPTGSTAPKKDFWGPSATEWIPTLRHPSAGSLRSAGAADGRLIVDLDPAASAYRGQRLT